MTAVKPGRDLGRLVFALGVVALALVALALGDFLPGQPVPKGFPDRAVLAYAVAGFMLLAGAGIAWRRTAGGAAGLLCAYYALVVVGLMDGRVIARHAGEFIAYSNTAEQAAIAAAALMIFAAQAGLERRHAGPLARLGQAVFGVCAVLFGLAHFFYMNLTAPLVPAWLPPSQLFWGYATGVAQIAAGAAILAGVRARLAAVLLTAMYLVFQVLVHLRMLAADPGNHGIWVENATNLVLTGAAWVTADSVARRKAR